MKLTPENLDYEDCRPGTGVELDMDLVSEHMKARILARQEELANARATPAKHPDATSPEHLRTAAE